MESHPSVTDRHVRIPPMVWVLGLGLIVALVAIFVFNVALNTVAYFGFIALMIGSHLFMHGSHGGSGGHSRQNHQANMNATDDASRSQEQHTGHRGSCH